MANFVKPYKNDPFVGHLSTPITTSAATRAILGNLPAYRKMLVAPAFPDPFFLGSSNFKILAIVIELEKEPIR